MHLFFLVLIQVLYFFSSSSSILAVQYEVTNTVPDTPGGSRFDKEIGISYTQETMKTINNFIWNKFQQYNVEDRVDVDVVKLFIVYELKPNWAGYAWGNVVNISSTFMANYQGNDFRREFTSLLYHEMTHVFQWYGGAHQTPQVLIEGIADYISLVSGYTLVTEKPGDGDKWDEGYGVTARFLEYCEGLKSGFVAQLNKMMGTDYSEELFLTLLGKPVDQLWKEYKANYGYNI